jgi:membrane protein DedA with SNARE-associated domain
MINFIAHLSWEALYPTLFVGIIFLGGIILLPAMYLAMTGAFSLFHLFIITLLSNITAETIWYTIGMYAKKERLYKLRYIKKRTEEAEKFSDFFLRHGTMLVFVSKFVYGTRIAGQILAGMHRINFLKFLFATTVGSMIWFGIFYILLRGADLGIASVKETTKHIQLTFLIVAGFLAVINIFTGTVVRKRMLK